MDRGHGVDLSIPLPAWVFVPAKGIGQGQGGRIPALPEEAAGGRLGPLADRTGILSIIHVFYERAPRAPRAAIWGSKINTIICVMKWCLRNVKGRAGMVNR